MKIFLIAGEASGDLHGAILSQALLKEDPSLQLVGWGGDRMQEKGVRILSHYKNTAIMGLGQVIKKMGTIRKKFSDCKQQILTEKPTAIYKRLGICGGSEYEQVQSYQRTSGQYM